MSYDINLYYPTNGFLRGLESKISSWEDIVNDSTYGELSEIGIRSEWVNISYNYCRFFLDSLGDYGIRTIYGMTGEQSIPILEEAIKKFGDIPPGFDLRESTAWGAKQHLINLLAMAKEHPEGIWKGD